MAKEKVTDLRKRYYPELAPDRDYPPLRFESLKGKVSSAEWEARVAPEDEFEKTSRMYQPGVRRTMGLLEWPAMRRLADRLDPSYKT